MTTRRTPSIIVTMFTLIALILVLVPNQANAATANVGYNIDQWANTPSSAWQNGNLHSGNSTYSEGDVVPFRVAVEGMEPATNYTFHIEYDFTAAGHEAYDFLATYTSTEPGATVCLPGGTLSTLCPSLPAPTTAPFPSDTFQPLGDTQAGLTVAGAEALLVGSRNLTIWGGTIVSITGPVHSGPTSGNSTATFTVVFNAGTCSVAPCASILAWGGHLAQSAYWKTTTGTANGAGMISGAPFHVGIDGQDRSIQPGALQTALELVKDLNSIDEPGASGTFNLFIQEDALTADQVGTNVQDFSSGPQSYDITEITPFTFYESGYGTTLLTWYWRTVVCKERISNIIVGQTLAYLSDSDLTINISPGQDIVCTIVNRDIPTAAGIVNARAVAGDDKVTVSWEAPFVDTLGYHVLRDGAVISELFTPSGPNSAFKFVDNNVKVGETYTYWIQTVEGEKEMLAPVVIYRYLKLPIILR